ncbi:MAG: Long-chain-fatty-acid--CoA ligase [uncultured Corynebacteriales bacterium]|uniref:Acyl-CoA synthetase n=1 Tax=uncultured Mycobacteriales bacterium TaxID=581187 RepID=A0A6J4IQK1_9ACTN|nr:MAG: Long-chain-fatty-acid--CoA ligase [uncultured Corynebacteriales bacterium]
MVDAATVAAEAAGQTVAGWVRRNAAELPDTVAVRRMAPDGSGLVEWTWAEVADRSARLARAYGRLGLERGDRVLLFLRNRPEFHVADLGAVLAGGTPLSVYNSSSPEQLGQLASHSRSRIAVVEDVEFLERLLKVRDQLPDLRAVVVATDPAGPAPADVLRLEDLFGDDPVDLDAAADAVRPEDLATVIYTSGTTGPPKGVMLSHSNIAHECVGYTHLVGKTPGRRSVSYLPMAHIAERMVTHYAWLWQRSAVTCCPDQTTLGAYLAQVHPTDLFGPPRVWEKLRAGIQAGVAAGGPEKVAGFAKALEVGRQVAAVRAADQPLTGPLAAAWEQVDAAAFAPLRARLGLDRLEFCFSGAAPLPVDVLHFFRSLGMPFSEVYGMSENTGGMTWDPFRVKPHTVGRPYPGVELRIAADGEVLARGGIVSRGYLDDPERTAETFDADGWLHTGDIGRVDDDGYLSIVDRKKELIITAGGKNVSPANLEALLKSLPLVGQACVVGDGQRYIAALLVLDPDVAPGWAERQGLPTALPELAATPELRAELERGVAEVNAQVSNVEGIKRFAIVADEWVPDSPQLTATMKLKRRGVHAAYADVIAALYTPA